MRTVIRKRIVYVALAIAAVAPWSSLWAQRLSGRIDGRYRTTLRGSRNPRIEGLVSDGPVEDATRISGMTFRFRPTDAQLSELEQLLDDQQNPASPKYHAWLTPDEYADRFGLSRADFQAVADWIVSEGFEVDHAAESRTYLSFSGTAAQVRDVFQTELRRYRVNGKTHFANVREIAIPAQLERLVYTVVGLDDFHRESKVQPKPRITGDGDTHALTPFDLAVIYNLMPLYKARIWGTGQKIAVAGEATLNLDDVRLFRDIAGLPPSEPKLVLAPGSKEPGYTDAAGEALLDVEYAGGAAPGATVVYVYHTNVVVAAQYAIDQNVAPVLSFSFSVCEKRVGNWAFWRNLAQQAAAQGITWVASTGDTGAAGCEFQETDAVGISGIAVNAPASVPEVTAVGGTTFVEGTGKYWSDGNQPGGASALSYIPEMGWNDTRPGTLLSSGGGGISIAYPRPSWQTGNGMPTENGRHVPDIALAASPQHDPYLMVQTGTVIATGGTSAGTPFFAGVVALLNQYMVDSGAQARPGLGNINPRLYQLAQTRGVFHDVTAGNNIVPCKAGTPDCANGRYGYSAGPGYDHVTGLGSIDAAAMVENWTASKSSAKTAAVVPSVTPTPVYQEAADEDGFSWFYTIHLTETAGAPATITGFAIDDYDLSDYIADWFGSTTVPAKGSLSVDMRARDLQVPSDHIFVFAGVDNTGQRWTKQIKVPFLGAQSGKQKGAAMSLSSNPVVVVKTGSGDPSCAKDHPFGQQLILRELNGSAVRLTKFIAGGYDYSNNIATWFGSQTLPASGTLQTKLCWQLNSVPTTLSYEMDGVDASGGQVQATLRVDFKDPLDMKSGIVYPSTPGALSAWPGQPAAAEAASEREERRRRSNSPKLTRSGMVVAPRIPVRTASPPLNGK